MSNYVRNILESILKKPYLLLACACVLSLAGCADLPYNGQVPLVEGHLVDAETVTGNSVAIVLTPVCDFYSDAALDQLLTESGFGFAAGLVRISKADLTGITITATEGDFNDFTQAGVTLVSTGSPVIELGSAQNPAGLGTEVELTPDGPVDLRELLNGGDCGLTTLNFTGTPEENITLNAAANLEVSIHIGLF